MLGLNLAFDRGNLTDHFASRPYTYVYFLIATFTAKARAFGAQLANAFSMPVRATVVA